MIKKIFLVSFLLSLFISPIWAKSQEKTPPCYGEERYPTQSTLVGMVNAKIIKDFASIYKDVGKPYHLKTTLLDSKKIGRLRSSKGYPEVDIYRQIQKFEVTTKEGQSFEVLTISEVSPIECSMSSVKSFILSPEFKVISDDPETILTKENKVK